MTAYARRCLPDFLTLLAACAFAPGLAAQQLYGEIGVQGVYVPGGSEAGVHSTSATSTGLVLRAGYAFTPNVAIETDLGLGLQAGRSDLTLDDIEPADLNVPPRSFGGLLSGAHRAGSPTQRRADRAPERPFSRLQPAIGHCHRVRARRLHLVRYGTCARRPARDGIGPRTAFGRGSRGLRRGGVPRPLGGFSTRRDARPPRGGRSCQRLADGRVAVSMNTARFANATSMGASSLFSLRWQGRRPAP